MFVRMKGIRPHKDKDTLMWIDEVKNVYFHLNLDCLKKLNPTFEVETLTRTEMFTNISDLHISHLRNLGILEHIIAQKGKAVEVSTVHKKQ